MEMRIRLAAAYIRPLLDWAAPFHRSSPSTITTALYEAVTGTRCTWWCRARWWAERITNHPTLGVAIRGLHAGGRYLQWHSPHLVAALHSHAKALHLRVVGIVGTTVLLAPTPAADPRLHAHIASTYAPDSHFAAHGPRAAHTLRVAARLAVLTTTKRTRHDTEGIDDVDVEASSSRVWKR
jgi:hypothetical protein